MNIIRDEETHGLFMIPLFHQYGIHYCHVKDCPYKASTILTDIPFADAIGICEYHYQQAKTAGKWNLSLDLSKDQTFQPVE
jgi:hypothetical protein